jgi:hypothetical protein
MADQLKGRFWWGPIRTEANARFIISVVGWCFVGFGALGAVSAIREIGNPAGFFSTAIVAVFLLAPGGFLLTRKNRVSAFALLALSGLGFALSVIAAVYIIAGGGPEASFSVVPPIFLGPASLDLLARS